MTTAPVLHREHERLKPFIDLALKEGWKVACTPCGHLRFIKQGLTTIYTGSPALREPCHWPANNAKGGPGANG